MKRLLSGALYYGNTKMNSEWLQRSCSSRVLCEMGWKDSKHFFFDARFLMTCCLLIGPWTALKGFGASFNLAILNLKYKRLMVLHFLLFSVAYTCKPVSDIPEQCQNISLSLPNRKIRVYTKEDEVFPTNTYFWKVKVIVYALNRIYLRVRSLKHSWVCRWSRSLMKSIATSFPSCPIADHLPSKVTNGINALVCLPLE